MLSVLAGYLKQKKPTNDTSVGKSPREHLRKKDSGDQQYYDNRSFHSEKESNSSSSVELVLYCPDSYHEQRKIEEAIISFVSKNFWYYLNRFQQKNVLNELNDSPISSVLITMINEESDRNIEFPNVNHRKRGGGIVPNSWNHLHKPQKHENQRSGLPISNELNDAILRSVNSRIIGEILELFSDTSVGELIGYRTNHKLAIY